MNGSRDATRALCAGALLVLAVPGACAAFGGTVAAQNSSDSPVAIESTNATDETVTARGTTSHEPGNTSITVEVVEGPSETVFEVAALDNWTDGGRWTTTLGTNEPPAEGTYVLEVSDGSVTETTRFQVGDNASVTLAHPTDAIVGAQPTTVNGTAVGVDMVTLYARDEGDFQRVQIGSDDSIAVADGEFAAEEVRLGQSGAQDGNDILGSPGTYRVALVAGTPGSSLTTADVAQRSSDTHVLRVTAAEGGPGGTATEADTGDEETAEADGDGAGNATSTDGADGPGFGILAALVGLASAGVLAAIGPAGGYLRRRR